ncbi:HPP family protein [Oculatella sp. FACHB-28]|uniref:HPP family protein n=1 Tax=Oculatella sp. FACHB-28 TaxID=2692845 RepID=UPI001683986B|nr:HPP family protein [Oculatella sp. FACHB-28]MBD2054517.1 HPP family protein [Oculatella sp. FACHB-28]
MSKRSSHQSDRNPKKSSLKPIEGANRSLRSRLSLQGEFALALAPTVVILAVLAFVEVLSRQRLLFASLASSAFLIYLDPQHGTNTVRTLTISQLMAATIGLVTYLLFGSSYLSAGIAMILTITLMIVLDAVHPPAVATSLSFALRAGNETNLALFGLAVGVIALLIAIERCALWLLAYYSRSR